MRTSAIGIVALTVLSTAAAADTVNIGSSRDNTLYQDTEGDVSNGAGSGMFAGRNNAPSNNIRRALVRFDIASQIPAGSTITGATLTLSQSSANAGEALVSLHRLLQDWGEGASSGTMGGGGGAPAAAGDATWQFSFFPATPWGAPGGSFAAAASASTIVAETGTYSWSSPNLVADIQAFLDSPASNFGWLLRGDEAAPSTAKRFSTREESQTELRPILSVEYVVPGPSGLALLTLAAAAAPRRRRPIA